MKTKSKIATIPSDFVPKLDKILARGLCSGVGDRDGQMCVEAAVCAALDLPHGDDPKCVAASVRSFKIALNDKNWSSTKARANGLRSLAIAQVGSKGVIGDKEFATRLAEKTIRVLIPDLLRRFKFKDEKVNKDVQAAADRCEKDGTPEAARNARDVTRAPAAPAAADAAADAAAYATTAYATTAADAYAADAYAYTTTAAAAYATTAAYAYATTAADANPRFTFQQPKGKDYFLLLMARLGLEVLKDMNAPGVALLD